MHVTLERFAYTDDGVFGWLRVGDLKLFTVERPWRDNLPFKSAIPVGEYPLRLGMYYGGDGEGGNEDYPAYELQNVPGRGLIKIHVANTMDNLLGCIGLGMDTGYVRSPKTAPKRWAVSNSKKALGLFMKKMEGTETGMIEIFNTDSLSREAQ